MTKQKTYKKQKHLDKMVEDLHDAAGLEGSEVGEMWSLIASLFESYSDIISPELLASLEAEIRQQHEILCKEFIITEDTETVERTHTRLVYVG